MRYLPVASFNLAEGYLRRSSATPLHHRNIHILISSDGRHRAIVQSGGSATAVEGVPETDRAVPIGPSGACSRVARPHEPPLPRWHRWRPRSWCGKSRVLLGCTSECMWQKKRKSIERVNLEPGLGGSRDVHSKWLSRAVFLFC